MAKVTFGSLNLKKQEGINKVSIGDKEIEVLSYLDISDKYDLIDATLFQSAEGLGYNAILLEMNFNLNIVFLYTNISFTENQRKDKYKLYDILETNGIFTQIIENIPQEEYKELMNLLKSEIDRRCAESQTAAGMINNILEKTPKTFENASQMIENFDVEKFQNALRFANAIGADIE